MSKQYIIYNDATLAHIPLPLLIGALAILLLYCSFKYAVYIVLWLQLCAKPGTNLRRMHSNLGRAPDSLVEEPVLQALNLA